MTQHKTQHRTTAKGSSWSRLFTSLAAAIMFAAMVRGAEARDPYLGADSRMTGAIGGYEGSTASGHPHGWGGFYGYPNLWTEGHARPSDHGHSGDYLRFGRGATPPGQVHAGYVIQRPFLRGRYDRRCERLFTW